jgi:hypothetical protein
MVAINFALWMIPAIQRSAIFFLFFSLVALAQFTYGVFAIS